MFIQEIFSILGIFRDENGSESECPIVFVSFLIFKYFTRTFCRFELNGWKTICSREEPSWTVFCVLIFYCRGWSKKFHALVTEHIRVSHPRMTCNIELGPLHLNEVKLLCANRYADIETSELTWIPLPISAA